MENSFTVFDRRAVRLHRERAAHLGDGDFLLREVAEHLLDRLDDVRRRFPLALDLGCHTGQLARLLNGRGGIETLVQCDLAAAMVRGATGLRLAADEEALPFRDGAFDLVLSCLSLHWVNDLPGALIQARRALKPDGLFLAALFGTDTARELRASLMAAELEVEGGASPRVAPFADVRDAGDLLVRAGFALPVADSDTLTVSYADPLRLMADLRAMGETNAMRERRKTLTRRETLLRAAGLYRERYGGADGRVPATFEVVFLTAWAPAAGQQQPLRPGSAQHRLAAALGGNEIGSGVPADPGRR